MSTDSSTRFFKKRWIYPRTRDSNIYDDNRRLRISSGFVLSFDVPDGIDVIRLVALFPGHCHHTSIEPNVDCGLYDDHLCES